MTDEEKTSKENQSFWQKELAERDWIQKKEDAFQEEIDIKKVNAIQRMLQESEEHSRKLEETMAVLNNAIDFNDSEKIKNALKEFIQHD